MSATRSAARMALVWVLGMLCTFPGSAQQVPASASSSPMRMAMPMTHAQVSPMTDHASMHGMKHDAMSEHEAAQGVKIRPKPVDTHRAKHEMGQAEMPVTDHAILSPAHAAKATAAGRATLSAMVMGSMQGGNAPLGARDPDYSDGIGMPSGRALHMHGDSRHSMVLLDRLEYFGGDDGHGVSLDAQAWYGGDINKLWLKMEGDYAHGRVQDMRSEALWSHAATAFWDTQWGVRHDGGAGPARDWVAFGVQGLAPYWLDVQATVYAGSDGRIAARAEVEYDLLFTQRLILTPRVAFNLYSKDDSARGTGRGLSDVVAGLRLRYEVRRRWAPYVGVVWSRRFGSSADFARRDGRPVRDWQWVAGMRIWF